MKEETVRQEHARMFVASKQMQKAEPAPESEPEPAPKVIPLPPEPVRPNDYELGTGVVSLTVASAVPYRGSETRSISSLRIEARASGLRMRTVTVGIEVTYRGTDLKPRTLLIPWSNVASLEPDLSAKL